MDRIVVNMPEDPRDFLISMGILQDYMARVAIGGVRKERDQLYDITIRMNEKFKCLEPCLKMVKEYTPHYDYSGWTEWARSEYDCFIDFDIENAKAIVKPFSSHISEGLGITIGVGPLGIVTGTAIPKWPNLRHIKLTRQAHDIAKVLVHSWDREEYEKFNKFISPKCVVMGYDILLQHDIKVLFEYVDNFDIFISKASVLTYLASCYNKTVIEMFDDKDEAYCYGNDGIRNYKALIGTPVKAEFLFAVFEDVWQSYQDSLSVMKSQDSKMPTELEVSTVEDAVEK